ncbi:helicase associated domain-containing protein [uncultured Prevotella sp.]|uniref:helicase associated domain-containing protein n=1 Tax=uncultured Prevotella sp. TaxID=159272 RepID=UPI00258B4370|nr:helicase associated domain-containing protein [uncultured Prevotella sp.]
MTQDERWLTRYNEVKEFIEREHRNPSKYRQEEHDMLNWLKANRKKMNADGLKPERVEKFKELLALTEVYRRKNQYE